MALDGLAGKVVIVTGGASGIGRASAERLLAEGAKVALVDQNADAVQQAVAELGDGGVVGTVADVSTEEGTERYFTTTLERFGRVDGLHANAGIEGPVGTIAEVEMDDFDRLMAVNLRGVFLAIRRMLRTLAQQGSGGAIVSTASALGLRGRPGLAPYSASKAAVISLTKTAAMEAGPSGIRVNAVLPGPTQTSMITRLWESSPNAEEVRAAMIAAIPLRRYGQPEDVAGLVAYLASPAGKSITGQTLDVTCGYGI